jgi:membrane protease YdiL (CAAX protease family)
MDEEFVWRGVLLPRQEQALGKHACLMNCAGWTLFHLAFGWQLLLVLLPILVVTPYVVQQRQNTWIGVIIHAVLNGPSFLAIAFGLI